MSTEKSTTSTVRREEAKRHPNQDSAHGAAPLGTDAEAGGHPPSDEALRHAERQIEKHRDADDDEDQA